MVVLILTGSGFFTEVGIRETNICTFTPYAAYK